MQRRPRRQERIAERRRVGVEREIDRQRVPSAQAVMQPREVTSPRRPRLFVVDAAQQVERQRRRREHLAGHLRLGGDVLLVGQLLLPVFPGSQMLGRSAVVRSARRDALHLRTIEVGAVRHAEELARGVERPAASVAAAEKRLRVVDDDAIGKNSGDTAGVETFQVEVVHEQYRGVARPLRDIRIERRRQAVEVVRDAEHAERLERRVTYIEGYQHSVRTGVFEDGAQAGPAARQRQRLPMPDTGAGRRFELEETADRRHTTSHAPRNSRTRSTGLNMSTSTIDSHGTNAPPNCGYSIARGWMKRRSMPSAANRSRE